MGGDGICSKKKLSGEHIQFIMLTRGQRKRKRAEEEDENKKQKQNQKSQPKQVGLGLNTNAAPKQEFWIVCGDDRKERLNIRHLQYFTAFETQRFVIHVTEFNGDPDILTISPPRFFPLNVETCTFISDACALRKRPRALSLRFLQVDKVSMFMNYFLADTILMEYIREFLRRHIDVPSLDISSRMHLAIFKCFGVRAASSETVDHIIQQISQLLYTGNTLNFRDAVNFVIDDLEFANTILQCPDKFDAEGLIADPILRFLRANAEKMVIAGGCIAKQTCAKWIQPTANGDIDIFLLDYKIGQTELLRALLKTIASEGFDVVRLSASVINCTHKSQQKLQIILTHHKHAHELVRCFDVNACKAWVNSQGCILGTASAFDSWFSRRIHITSLPVPPRNRLVKYAEKGFHVPLAQIVPSPPPPPLAEFKTVPIEEMCPFQNLSLNYNMHSERDVDETKAIPRFLSHFGAKLPSDWFQMHLRIHIHSDFMLIFPLSTLVEGPFPYSKSRCCFLKPVSSKHCETLKALRMKMHAKVRQKSTPRVCLSDLTVIRINTHTKWFHRDMPMNNIKYETGDRVIVVGFPCKYAKDTRDHRYRFEFLAAKILIL